MQESDQAIEMARQAFRAHMQSRVVPDEVARRLSIGARKDGPAWVIEVRLLPHAPGSEGLETDLCYPPSRLLVAIRVDVKKGEVTLSEAEPPPW